MPLPSARHTRRDLVLSTIDGMACSVMVGCGETCLPAFAVALGLGPVAAGLVASVPLLVGATVQLFAPVAMARVRSSRLWVAGCVALQAASYAPLVWLAIRGRAELWQVLLAASVYWSAGMASLAAWMMWMAALVPRRVRAAFFTQRTRLSLVGIIGGLVFGWLVFRLAESAGGSTSSTMPFAVLFAVAGIARLVSAACMWASSERPTALVAGSAASPRSLVAVVHGVGHALRGIIGRPSGRLVAFLGCFGFAAQFAVPYFTPYLLDLSGMSYPAFVVVTAMGFVARLAFLPAIGRLASQHGAAHLAWRATLGLVPASLCWLVSADVAAIAAVQFIAGGLWAAHELAVTLLLFEAVDDRERMAVTTLHTLVGAVATTAGAACGGLMLHGLGESWLAYAAVFGVSAVLRLAALPVLQIIRHQPKHSLPCR